MHVSILCRVNLFVYLLIQAYYIFLWLLFMCVFRVAVTGSIAKLVEWVSSPSAFVKRYIIIIIKVCIDGNWNGFYDNAFHALKRGVKCSSGDTVRIVAHSTVLLSLNDHFFPIQLCWLLGARFSSVLFRSKFVFCCYNTNCLAHARALTTECYCS